MFFDQIHRDSFEESVSFIFEENQIDDEILVIIKEKFKKQNRYPYPAFGFY